jgi:hypothetical protein
MLAIIPFQARAHAFCKETVETLDYHILLGMK